MHEQIAPTVNTLNAAFWNAAVRAELVLPHCVASGRAFWPPSPSSPFVVDWRPAPPHGIVKSIATIHRGFQKAFEPCLPYAVALVECADQVRLQLFLADPRAVAVDDRVAIGFAAVVADGPVIPIVAGKAIP